MGRTFDEVLSGVPRSTIVTLEGGKKVRHQYTETDRINIARETIARERDAETTNTTITLWLPERDSHRLAALGKLAEECNELAARASRCIIQGLDEQDPKSGLTNKVELEREIADVFACVEQVVDRLDVRLNYRRQAEKSKGFDRWHRMISEAAQ